ncbi:hypothetical protein P2G88_12495 [Aliiglaciecola sp. CAU 1673]|uniref:hypothetical protein n=1 Tax=Aliiglaciecola sp. CAU 1673 TaxID=3032595 RepID=UPI0023DBDE38|nr:hypothetical protein [Aliiglaciecola sp. CAU 1673]MDF2179071.1 hypothetical protein [Aliiglaciecola sp. CAU 1673]
MRILLTLAALFSPLVHSACEGPEYDQFDFWLGSWQVTAKGTLAGTNEISADLDNCVLREHYRTESGFEGRSLNIYDKSRDLWHQTWVDNQGQLLQLEGRLEGGVMVLQGPGLSAKGEKHLHRIRWTPNMDGTVRQHWQVSKDDGETWTDVFDGMYRK